MCVYIYMYLLQYGKQLRENYRAFKNKQQVDSKTCSVPSVSVPQQHSVTCIMRQAGNVHDKNKMVFVIMNIISKFTNGQRDVVTMLLDECSELLGLISGKGKDFPLYYCIFCVLIFWVLCVVN